MSKPINFQPSHPPALSHYSLPHHQRGASVGGVVFVILTLGIFVKLAIAIVPAQVGDYQLNKAIAEQLKQSNNDKDSKQKFLEKLKRQLNVNADYETNPAEILTFTNERAGNLAVHKKYEVANNFFGNVDIVNRFEGDITAEHAAE